MAREPAPRIDNVLVMYAHTALKGAGWGLVGYQLGQRPPRGHGAADGGVALFEGHVAHPGLALRWERRPRGHPDLEAIPIMQQNTFFWDENSVT